MSNHRTPVIPLTIVTPATPGVIGSPQTNTKLAPAAPTNGSSQSFAQDHWNRYAHLKNVDEAKNALIEDVLSRYDAVFRQCQTLLDEKNEQESRSNANKNDLTVIQKQAEFISHLQTLINNNPFVVVVVDGNNFLFNDAFVRDGEKGGRRAALVFKDELTEWVSKSVTDAPKDFKVLVKVYADLKGLAGTFMRGGVTENLSTFSEFARGFNKLSLFDFIDTEGGDINNKIVGKSWSRVSFIALITYPSANFLQITSSFSFTITIATRSSLVALRNFWTRMWSKRTCFRDVWRCSKACPQT